MFRVNGFYGHVQANNLRSVVIFFGFVIAFELIGTVLLIVPLIYFDSKHALIFHPWAYFTRYAPVLLVLGASLFVFRCARHVAAMRASVNFTLVDRRAQPRLVSIVERLAITAGVPVPRVALIETEARNAFACGIDADSAVVVATRGLVEALDDDELAAVVAHEITHIKNGDICLMAAANVLIENLEWIERKNPFRLNNVVQVIIAVLFTPYLILAMLAGFASTVSFTLARVSRLLISSSREFIADAEAVRLTHNPAALISALRRIDGRSAVEGLDPRADAMMIDGAVEGAFASHPTIAERIAVLTRLSGPMAHAAGPRVDTRPLEQAVAHRAAFGLRPGPGPLPATATAAPAVPGTLLLQRVNAGSNKNLFGLTPRTRRMLTIGFCLLAALQVWTIWRVKSMPEFRDQSTPAQKAEWKRRDDLQRIAKTDPAKARCYATDVYSVGDRGFHRVKTPDPGLVAAYATGKAGGGSSDVPIEKYLASKQASVRTVTAAQDDQLDQALVSYVKQRELLTEIVHRFYGTEGLRLFQQAYDSPQDHAVVDTLRRRLDAGAPALLADRRLAADMRFLVSAPDAFVPCIARASQITSG
ncbi:M48 family metalloprotease [Rhodoplanes roseus]|uniref:Peptidase M48 domain-containing protein n=2 Tax=Rhodoplanes TaxID=29407 RepID=A0A327KUU1_9BRAD|nr:M48 family metalloprotease [Rhodoplanes roseus]RAI41235.1 hypothetical protein CH341_22095 [Rhodoplanes roseus]